MSRTLFIKVTDSDFSMASMWPVDYVGPFNEVVAKWIIDHDYGVVTDSDGTPVSDPLYTPALMSALVANATPTIIETTFTTPIAVTDATGIVVTVDDVSATVSSAAAVAGVLEITMAAAITVGQTVRVLYDGLTGNVVNATWTLLEAISGGISATNDVVAVAVAAAVPQARSVPKKSTAKKKAAKKAE